MTPTLRLAAPIMALSLAACASTGMSEVAPTYLEQAPARQTYATPLDAAQSLVGNFPEAMEGAPALDLHFAPLTDDPSLLEMIIASEGLLDDSVSAQEWRAVLVQGDDLRWRITELGLRQKCSRSSNPDEWVAQLCI